MLATTGTLSRDAARCEQVTTFRWMQTGSRESCSHQDLPWVPSVPFPNLLLRPCPALSPAQRALGPGHGTRSASEKVATRGTAPCRLPLGAPLSSVPQDEFMHQLLGLGEAVGGAPALQQLSQAFHLAAPTCERTQNRDCRKAWLAGGVGWGGGLEIQSQGPHMLCSGAAHQSSLFSAAGACELLLLCSGSLAGACVSNEERQGGRGGAGGGGRRKVYWNKVCLLTHTNPRASWRQAPHKDPLCLELVIGSMGLKDWRLDFSVGLRALISSMGGAQVSRILRAFQGLISGIQQGGACQADSESAPVLT